MDLKKIMTDIEETINLVIQVNMPSLDVQVTVRESEIDKGSIVVKTNDKYKLSVQFMGDYLDDLDYIIDRYFEIFDEFYLNIDELKRNRV